MGYEPKLVGYIDQADRNVFPKEGKSTTTFHLTTNTWKLSTDIFNRVAIRREGNRDR